jgi:glycosyltransferase involved in cell wall biosynthesis
VSVLTTVFNCERFVREAIESVRTQTSADWEHIVVDDASTDRTAAIVAETAQEDGRLRVSYLPQNLGPGGAMQAALGQARGEYVAVLDADDVCEPERLRRQVEFCAANPRIAVLGTWVQTIDEHGAALAVKRYTENSDLLSWTSYHAMPLTHSSMMMRTELLRRVGGYDRLMWTMCDYDVVVRMSEVGDITCLPEVLVRYRKSPGQITQAHVPRQMNQMILRIHSLLRTRFGLHASLSDVRGYYPGLRKSELLPTFVERWIELQAQILDVHLRWRPMPEERERLLRLDCARACRKLSERQSAGFWPFPTSAAARAGVARG